MKKPLLVFVFLCLISFSAIAVPVSGSLARKAAVGFLKSIGAKETVDCLEDVTAQTTFSHLFIFSINNDKGFVIISGDDHSEPVLAYSLSSPFPIENMPAHVRAWLDGYDRQIVANAGGMQSKSVSKRWRDVVAAVPEGVAKELIPKMIETKWGQSPYYNHFCPSDGNEYSRPPCGCTATATAQIMKYFNHPSTGYGYGSFTHHHYGLLTADYGHTTYQWDSMPVRLNEYSTQAQIDAVATLIYHIGVAVHMDYQVGGSAGKTASYGYGGEPSSENAFKYFFGYSPYIWTAFRIDYSLEDWKLLMLNELRNGRPILYAGYDEVQSGHAFIIDGYNSANDRFHLNWGWNGSYDGYFKLDDLNPGGSSTNYHFDLFATATIGIEPYADFDTSSVTTVVTGVEGEGSVTGAGTYNFGDTITLTATAGNEATHFVEWSDGCRYNPRSTVATGGTVSFVARFQSLRDTLVRYHTCDNAMNRASNLPEGLGCDSVWGVKIHSSVLRPHYDITAVRFMGRREGTHTLSIYSGIDHPEEVLYSATFFDSLDYPYTWYQHNLPSPLVVDNSKSLWVTLKCTDVDTPGVFSIYGGNPNGMLVGDDMSPRTDWKFSWMIETLFSGDGLGIGETGEMASMSLFPNPATNKVTLSGLVEDAIIEFIDMNGTVCLKTAVLTAGAKEHELDVSALAPGCYLVRVYNGLHSSVKKLVIR